MMTHIFSRRSSIVLLVLMFLLVSSACQAVGTAASTQTAGISPALTQEATQTAGAPAATPEPTVVPTQGDVIRTVVLGPGTFNLIETAAGLADLASYTATLTLSFDGTQDGQPQKWSRKYMMLTTHKPAARQLTIEQTGDVSQPTQGFMAELDGVTYARLGDNPCSANVIVPEDSLAKASEPAGFLTSVFGADPAGSETVNSAAAGHYTFDERALLGMAGIAKSTGEMWVATEGGYIVKYLLTTKGGADYFGDGSEGTQTWDYELTGANQPVSIEIPNDCPAGLVDAPLLPDASNVESMPGMLTYETSTSLADAAAFYAKQIPALGWKVSEGEPDKPEVADSAVVLDFTKADKTMSIVLTSDQGVITVDITLTR
jgi:hypothetical protein